MNQISVALARVLTSARKTGSKELPPPNKKPTQGTPTIKQVLPPEKEKRSTDDLFVLLFARLALQGIVCYTYKSVLSGGKYK